MGRLFLCYEHSNIAKQRKEESPFPSVIKIRNKEREVKDKD